MLSREEILADLEQLKRQYREQTKPLEVPATTFDLNRSALIAYTKMEALCSVLNTFTPRHEEIWRGYR